MADIEVPFGGQYPAKRKFQDLGDGTYAEVVAIGGTVGTITLTGDLVVDTLGALNNARVTNPDAASATIPALLRGLLDDVAGEYETVAASQTDQVLGATGGVGDYLRGLLIIPGVAAAGTVSIKDGNGSAITLFAGGGVTPLPSLVPVFVPLGMRAKNATTPGWKVTTGADVTAIGVGNFT
jgi:hypothetical protein